MLLEYDYCILVSNSFSFISISSLVMFCGVIVFISTFGYLGLCCGVLNIIPQQLLMSFLNECINFNTNPVNAVPPITNADIVRVFGSILLCGN